MNIRELKKIVFCPEDNINKSSYTPMYIEVSPLKLNDGIKRYKSYDLVALLEHIIVKDNCRDLAMLFDDFPNAINLTTSDGNILIHACIIFNAMNCFKLLKHNGLSLELVGLGEENVYEEVLNKPLFWKDTYNDLDDSTIYEKLTSSRYFEHGAFEKLLKGTEHSNILLSQFKNNYPEVFKKIKENYIEQNCLTKITGQTLRIVMEYVELEMELQESYKNNIIKSDNILKF